MFRCRRILARALAVVLLAAVAVVPGLADEGMWTLDNLPLQQLEETYGFKPSSQWLEHVREASIRFGRGGSASFVSADGLVLTNHHVVAGTLQQLEASHPGIVASGFLALTPEQEIRMPGVDASVLASMENVTDRIEAAAGSAESPDAAVRARQAEIAAIKKEAQDETGLRASVVALYNGGEYWLYLYRTYDDLRLVWVPEQAVANFGGDPDNFTYPRHDLDAALVRAYQDGKPAKIEHYLRFEPEGARTGELVFVPGHPGNSDRLLTVAQLEHQRDHELPELLERMRILRADLEKYSARGPDQARKAQMWLFFIDNSLKANSGELRALLDERAFGLKRAQEQELREKVASRPEWRAEYAPAWEEVERLYAERGDDLRRWTARKGLSMPFVRTLSSAMNLVLFHEEIARPDGERLEGFHDAELPRLRMQLFAPVPVFPDLEAVVLERLFRTMLEVLPEEDSLRQVIAGLGDPSEAAQRLASGTKLTDAGYRRDLFEGGPEAIAASDDPMIALARKLAPLVRQTDAWMEKNVDSVLVPASEKIARARFAVYGKSSYPDATSSLRLTFGPVRGYPMNGTFAPPRTTLFGLFDRSLGFDQQPPWQLPPRFWERRERLDMTTPVNFVCECDIIGGNSGSPVINENGEVVGLIFDGNIESLANAYVFDPERSRGVAVHAAYILEALEELYDAGPLAGELRHGRRVPVETAAAGE